MVHVPVPDPQLTGPARRSQSPCPRSYTTPLHVKTQRYAAKASTICVDSHLCQVRLSIRAIHSYPRSVGDEAKEARQAVVCEGIVVEHHGASLLHSPAKCTTMRPVGRSVARPLLHKGFHSGFIQRIVVGFGICCKCMYNISQGTNAKLHASTSESQHVPRATLTPNPNPRATVSAY